MQKAKMTRDFIRLVVNFDLVKPAKPVVNYTGKTYKNKDTTDESIFQLYKNFSNGSVDRYLQNMKELCDKFPIVEQDFFKG